MRPRILLTLLSGLFIGLATVSIISGCQSKPEQTQLPKPPETQDVTVYFSKSKGNTSVTEGVVRHMPKDYPGSTLQYAIEQLVAGPNADESTAGFFSEIPKGTEVISVAENPKTHQVDVNLSTEFTSGGGSNSILQRYAELQGTVKANENKRPVSIKINNKLLEVAGGEGLEVPAVIKPTIQ